MVTVTSRRVRAIVFEVSAKLCWRDPYPLVHPAEKILVAGEGEQEVGEAVEINEGFAVDRLLFGQEDDEPFPAAADATRDVDLGGGWGSARQNEMTQRGQRFGHAVNFGFEPRGIRGANARRGSGLSRGGKVATDSEKLVLYFLDHGADEWLGACGLGRAEEGI